MPCSIEILRLAKPKPVISSSLNFFQFQLFWKLSLMLLLLESFTLWREKREQSEGDIAHSILVNEHGFYLCCAQNICGKVSTKSIHCSLEIFNPCQPTFRLFALYRPFILVNHHIASRHVSQQWFQVLWFHTAKGQCIGQFFKVFPIAHYIVAGKYNRIWRCLTSHSGYWASFVFTDIRLCSRYKISCSASSHNSFTRVYC